MVSVSNYFRSWLALLWVFKASTGITSDRKLWTQRAFGLATLHSEQNTPRQPNYNSSVFWKYGCRLRYTLARKGHTENNKWQLKVCLQLRNSQFQRQSCSWKWCTEPDFRIRPNSKRFTETKIRFCLYVIHVYTTDNVRPQQWPHVLSNKLQVFYENLQVFYENLQVFYRI